jgi:hypothetical protein
MLRLSVVVENDESAALADIAHIGSNVVISNMATGTTLSTRSSTRPRLAVAPGASPSSRRWASRRRP